MLNNVTDSFGQSFCRTEQIRTAISGLVAEDIASAYRISTFSQSTVQVLSLSSQLILRELDQTGLVTSRLIPQVDTVRPLEAISKLMGGKKLRPQM